MSADVDVAQLQTSSPDVEVTDPVKASASDSDQQLNEGAPLLPDDITDSDLKHTAAHSFANESRVSSPSPSARPMNAECPTEFSHPAAVEEQRIIWLPKDPLGLVHDLEQELASHNILYSSDGAEMDSQGNVVVTSASPEDVRRAPIPRPCEREGDEKGILSLWDMMSVAGKYE